MDKQPSPQPTQATQPCDDVRRHRYNLSDISQEDLSDVICVLHPNSPAAFHAVQATMMSHPQHILQNNDLRNLTPEDIDLDETYASSRDIALRISSKVKIPESGFLFGRTADHADIVLVRDADIKSVSNKHFKIFVNEQGSLMIQDMSTNGIIVDDIHLHHKDRNGQILSPRHATLALQPGTLITVVGRNRAEIKFLLRIPSRGECEDKYEDNLRRYLKARGQVAQFASMRESVFGNHWNGGLSYNITGQLGKGAFATVFRVQTKKEGRVLAAKELDKRKFMRNGILDIKFDSELKIMQSLKHPNIVQYVDCHTHDNWIYIIMEYIAYGELSKEMDKRGAIPESMVQSITLQILSALRYLHSRNIVHRDIKPDNILIASKDPLVVKLSDFGLSKCVENEETFLKTFCGTLLYCAPEIYPDYFSYQTVAANKRRRFGEPTPKPSPYDKSVDMWSFGAVLFHILSGRAPIMGRNDDRGATMLANIMTKDVDFSPLRAAGASEHAIDFIGALLQRNPLNRPTEKECFNHPWLKDIAHPFGYVEEPEVSVHAETELSEGDAVANDEDIAAVEVAQDLEQMCASIPVDFAHDYGLRSHKKPRLDNPAVTEIQYPVLPTFIETAASPQPLRLFGEIDPSTLASSGVLGVPVDNSAAIRKINNQIERISVNDFVSNDSRPVANRPTSAASLLGAEAQIGDLNMASPEVVSEDAVTPDTANPVTPETQSDSSTHFHNNAHQVLGVVEDGFEHPVFERRINATYLENPDSFQEELKRRELSRQIIKQQKATTFQVHSLKTSASTETARTIDLHTGRPIGSRGTASEADIGNVDRPVRLSTDFRRTPRRFGKLTALAGSYTNVTINLERRITAWGRAKDCHVTYPDVQDVRIPKKALTVVFHAPGIEEYEKSDQDWTQCPGIYTGLATQASKCIWVNGVEIRMTTADQNLAQWGRIYTGDIITVYQDPKSSTEGEYLKFEVEINFGACARRRPEGEKPFVIETEQHVYQRWRQSSMRLNGSVNHQQAVEVAAQ